MRKLLLLSCLVALVAACRSPAPVAEAPANNDELLKTALHQYVVEFLRRNPTVNTYLGGSGFDPALDRGVVIVTNGSIGARQGIDAAAWAAVGGK